MGELLLKEGRPTKYQGKKTLDKVREYLDTCRLGDLPKVKGLALFLGITKPTIGDWRAQHAEFSYLIEKLLLMQACALIDRGLTGTYNPTIAKVLLAKHGYS
ncbi:MAG: terminase small subunit [Gammaproteobacteria bacterium]